MLRKSDRLHKLTEHLSENDPLRIAVCDSLDSFERIRLLNSPDVDAAPLSRRGVMRWKRSRKEIALGEWSPGQLVVIIILNLIVLFLTTSWLITDDHGPAPEIPSDQLSVPLSPDFKPRPMWTP